MQVDREPLGISDQLKPVNHDTAYNFIMLIRDHSLLGLPDDQVVSIAANVGMEVTDQPDARFQSGNIIVRRKITNFTRNGNPERIGYYEWMIPESSEALDRLIAFFHERVILEMMKPEAERDKKLLELGEVLTPAEAEIKEFYLARIAADKTASSKKLI